MRAATAATAVVALSGTGAAGAGTSSTARDPMEQAAAPSPGCPDPVEPSSSPRDLVALGDTVFFTANDGVHGRELWKSDGTADGTVMVENINRQDRERRPGSNPRYAGVAHGMLYFSADDGVHGAELWRSDGTRAGTVLVKDINASGSSVPQEVTPSGDGFFFTAHDDIRGRQLWKSDGTRSGTVIVKKIAPTWGESYYGAPHYLTAMGRRVYFVADDNKHGVELWRSNGSRAGTVMVKNIDRSDHNDPVDYPNVPMELTRMGGRIYFAADDDVRGEELWRSDGSRTGTVLVKDIDDRKRFGGGAPRGLTRLGDQLFFTAQDRTHGRELWTTDGTRSGTAMVKDIVPTRVPGGTYDAAPNALTAVADELFFFADDGTGTGLWKSDGRRAGTTPVERLGGHEEPVGSTAAVGDQLFFVASDGTPGLGLWESDGSTEGTVLLKDFKSCDDSYYPVEGAPGYLTAQGARLFFAAEDVDHGTELWSSDGTAQGTVLVKDIRPEPTQ